MKRGSLGCPKQMKPETPMPNDEALHRVLQRWRIDGPLPPRFHEKVWQRIAQAETRPGSGLLAALCRKLEAILPRPAFAIPYMAVFILLGATAGALAAQAKTRRLEADLSVRYVQSVDPYRTGATHP